MIEIIADEEKTSMLGYPDLFVSTSGSTDVVYQVYAQPSLYRADRCPVCGKRNHIQQRGYQPRTIRDYVIDDNGKVKMITVKYNQRQYACVDGKHSFAESINSFRPEERFSERLKRYIFFLSCCSETSWSKVAKHVGISFGTVASIREKIKSSINLIAKQYLSPTTMAIRALTIKGKPYTLIANLKECTIVGFYSGRPEDVLSLKKEGKYFVENSLFENTQVVVVDPCCKYAQALRARVKPTCTIVADQRLLYNQIYEDLISVTQRNLTVFKAKKFEALLAPDDIIRDQRLFNFINRVLSDSAEIKKAYIAYTSFHNFLNKGCQLTDREKSELMCSLEDNAYVPETLIEDTLRIRTYDDYYGIDEFRRLCDVIASHFTANARISSAELIVDEGFLCVPNTIEERGKLYSSKAVSCFERCYVGGTFHALGKSFTDIERNLNYKKEYISGKCAYEGPERIS